MLAACTTSNTQPYSFLVAYSTTLAKSLQHGMAPPPTISTPHRDACWKFSHPQALTSRSRGLEVACWHLQVHVGQAGHETTAPMRRTSFCAAELHAPPISSIRFAALQQTYVPTLLAERAVFIGKQSQMNCGQCPQDR